MLYTIKYNDVGISSSVGTLEQIHYNGKLQLKANTAGSLEFMFPYNHISHDVPQCMADVISVERDHQEIFFGRVAQYTDDKNMNRTFKCEGALSTLGEISMSGQSASSLSLTNFLTYCRNQRSEFPWHTLSTLTLPISGETAKDVLANYIKQHGGYFYTYRSGVYWMIDYSADYLTEAQQEIRYMDNLTDISIITNPELLPSDFSRQISVKAFDKAYIDSNYVPFNLLDGIHVKSDFHGVDETIVCSQLDIDLNDASASKISLGKTVQPLTTAIRR